MSRSARWRLLQIGSHLVPPNCVPAASKANPFDELDGPLTWSRALAAVAARGTPPYRPGPLTPEQWHEWWEDGWTVVKAPLGAIDYAALHATLAQLLEENAASLSVPAVTSLQHTSGDAWEGLLRRQGTIETAVPGNTAGKFSALARPAVLHCDAMRRAVSHPSIVGVARQLTAAEDICLTGNYALRCKAPSEPLLSQGLPDGGTVPWHQDLCCERLHRSRVVCSGVAVAKPCVSVYQLILFRPSSQM